MSDMSNLRTNAIRTIAGLAWQDMQESNLPYVVPGTYTRYDADRIVNLIRSRAKQDGRSLSATVSGDGGSRRKITVTQIWYRMSEQDFAPMIARVRGVIEDRSDGVGIQVRLQFTSECEQTISLVLSIDGLIELADIVGEVGRTLAIAAQQMEQEREREQANE